MVAELEVGLFQLIKEWFRWPRYNLEVVHLSPSALSEYHEMGQILVHERSWGCPGVFWFEVRDGGLLVCSFRPLVKAADIVRVSFELGDPAFFDRLRFWISEKLGVLRG